MKGTTTSSKQQEQKQKPLLLFSSWFMLITTASTSIFVVVFGIIVANFLDLNKVVIYNDDECELLPDIGPGSEDIVVVNNNLALVSSGDLDRMVFQSGKLPRSGGIFAVKFIDSSKKENDILGDEKPNIQTEKVSITNYPKDQPFNPHGLHYSNITQRLYATNHECGDHNGVYEGVEIFKLVFQGDENNNNNDDENNSNNIKLIYERSILSKTFPLGSMNNVVEGAYYGEIYVTQWLSAPMSKTCVGGYDDNLWVETKRKFDVLFRRRTNVQRCTFNPDDQQQEKPVQCTVVANGFRGANGITSNPTKTQYYVIDAPDKAMHILDRNPENGSLVRQVIVKLPHLSDNVEYDMSSNKLTTIGLPYMHETIRRIDGDSSIQVSGGMVTIQLSLPNDDNTTNDDKNDSEESEEYESSYVVIDEVLMHDGSKLSEISSAVYIHGYILLGSPPSDGILVCPIPKHVLKSTTTTTIVRGG